MTTKKCKECGYEQDIRTDNRRKQNSKFRCTDCGTVNKLRIGAILAVFIIAIGFSAAYAYQETVDLPRSDYKSKSCWAVIWNPVDWQFDCSWAYGENTKIEYPREGHIIPLDPTADDPIEDMLRKIKVYLEEQARLSGTDDRDVGVDIPKTPTEPIQTEIDEQILDDFEKCFGGQEQAYAFQQEYSFQKFERIFKRFLSGDDKLAEECHAILLIRNYSNAAYPGMVVREDTSPQTKLSELKMSEGSQVTPEKLKKQAAGIQRPSWYQDPYGGWSGVNRGQSTPKITDDGINQFTGETSTQILEKYNLKKAADIVTKQDIINNNRELNKMVCETAWKTSGYGGLDIGKWRTFLADGWCNDKMDPVIFRGTEQPIESVIAYKLEQQKTETKSDLRTYK